MSYTIYVLENRTRGVFYVGLTSGTLDTRLRSHRSHATRRSGANPHKEAVIRTEGATIREITRTSTLEGARLLERLTIARLRDQGTNLTNLDAGGAGVHRWSAELRERQRAKMRLRHNTTTANQMRRRPVVATDANGRSYEYPSVIAAARALGHSRATNIHNALAGRAPSAYGFTWRHK